MKRAANIQQKVRTAEILGCLDIFATLPHSSDKGLYIIKERAGPREYTAFHANCSGRPLCFCK